MLSTIVKNTIEDVPDFPKPGVNFKDIAPLLLDANLCNEITDFFCQRPLEKPDAICAIESRGFFFGMLLANKLNVPFIMVRKKGKLPGEVLSESYDLEYGSATIEIQKKAIKKGQKVWIHDDVLATGGTAAAAARLLKKQDAQVLGFTFLMELSFLNGRDFLKSLNVPIESLVLY